MLNTFKGNVESDPMRIPAPAAMSKGNQDAFANALEEATAPRDPEPQPLQEAPADIDDELAQQASEQQSEATEAGETNAAGTDDADTTDLPAQALPHGTHPTPGDSNETQRRGEPGRQMTAGKGTDSPRTSSPRPAGEPLFDELAQLSMRSTQHHGQPAAAATQSPAPSAGKATGEALLRGIDASAPRGDGTATARAVKAGYRTNATATAQMLEQARDSIFKQILLKITGDGGEMRMRLEPPNLGELDLRFVVEKGNRLSLAITTERQDMADLIQRHVQELSETLAEAGLQLTNADVHARHAGDGEAEQQDAGQRDELGDDTQTNDTPGPRSGGYIRADGLDFWV